MLTLEAFREIFNNVKSKFFALCFQKILERMCIIKILILFYEADIICAIEFLYFNKNSKAICNQHKIIPRNKSTSEARIASATILERKVLGHYLARGLSKRAAIGAAINN